MICACVTDKDETRIELACVLHERWRIAQGPTWRCPCPTCEQARQRAEQANQPRG
jgi:hypothetical protein